MNVFGYKVGKVESVIIIEKKNFVLILSRETLESTSILNPITPYMFIIKFSTHIFQLKKSYKRNKHDIQTSYMSTQHVQSSAIVLSDTCTNSYKK